MELLDGLYRHGDALVTWDRHGVTLTRTGSSSAARATWDEIVDVRLVGVEQGFLQLVLHGRPPAPDYRSDRFAFAVNSEHDANRLMTSIRWYADDH